jgi:hypothetical protein
MPKSKKRKTRKNRPAMHENNAGPTLCPDFDLAPLRAYRRDVLLQRDGDDERTVLLKGFTLALALAFNDIKDIGWAAYQLRKGTWPEGVPRVSAYVGQWVGMDIAFGRFSAGFMTELGHCIERAHTLGLLETPAMRSADEFATRKAPAAAAAWKQLVLAYTARDERGLVNPVAKLLKQVRDNSGFHYGHRKDFKPLAAGYRDYFGAPPRPDGLNASAFASLGETQEETRFYFADATAGVYTQSRIREAGVDRDALFRFSRDLGKAVRYIVEALLEHFETTAATSDAAP